MSNTAKCLIKQLKLNEKHYVLKVEFLLNCVKEPNVFQSLDLKLLHWAERNQIEREVCAGGKKFWAFGRIK